MDWAQLHEIAPAQKASHRVVEFEHPSDHPHQECRDCRNFIKAQPNRCRTVAGPIAGGDWCIRFSRIPGSNDKYQL